MKMETDVETGRMRRETKVRRRDRLTEGVPLPSVQPPTLTSQAERHKTSRSQLSSSLDSSHTLQRLPSDTRFDTCSALSRRCVSPPPSSSFLQQNTNKKTAGSPTTTTPHPPTPGLKHAPSPVSDAWFCVKLLMVAGARGSSATPNPVPKKQQM